MDKAPRVLLVEDEMIVCMDLEDMLAEIGCRVIGPAARAERALALLDSEEVDAALLDINLGDGQTSLPVADALRARGVPFVLSTGYDEVAPEFRDAPLLQKPLLRGQLEGALRQLGVVR